MVTRNSPTMADICDILLINKYVDTNIDFSNFSIIYDDITKLLLKTFYDIDNIENIQKERELTSYGMIKSDTANKASAPAWETSSRVSGPGLSLPFRTYPPQVPWRYPPAPPGRASGARCRRFPPPHKPG